MSDFHIASVLIIVLFLAWVSLYLSDDILNPVFIFIACIYLNFTLSFFHLSYLQYSPQNIDPRFLFIYYYSGFAFIIFPLIVLLKPKKCAIYKYEMISYDRFVKWQSCVLATYVLLTLVSNYILSGKLVSIFMFDVFSYGSSLHTKQVPILTTIVIPFLGGMVFFEGLFYKRRASGIFRICLFIFLPLLRGSRLIAFDITSMFVIGLIISNKTNFRRFKNFHFKTLFYSVLVVLSVFVFFYAIGLIRSHYFYYKISWSRYWGTDFTGIDFIDEIVTFYVRYFVMSFDSFELAMLSIKPRNELFSVFLYPVIAFSQLDNIANFELIQETLSRQFNNSIENVTQVVGFFGPVYVVGGFGISIVFITIFSIVLISIYSLGVTKSSFRIALFAAMTNCLVLGSFTNTYIGLSFFIHILCIYFGFRLYQNGIQITKVGSGP